MSRMSPLTPDSATRSTDVDALLSRHSASTLGYIPDSHSTHFLSPAQRRSFEKRPPLINLGTHARTWAVDRLVEQFLFGMRGGEGRGQGQGREGRRQVVSLGAGTDTRFWRMRERGGSGKEKVGEGEGEGDADWSWVEVDFGEATAVKARVVCSKPALKDALGGDVKVEHGGMGLTSTHYALVPGDLRDWPSLSSSLLSSSSTGRRALLDPSLPTLLLAECVLVYLPPSTTETILNWFSKTFEKGKFVAYDPFGLDDSFGRVMIRNLATRNLALPGAAATPTLESLSERLVKAGFKTAESLSVARIRASVIPADELTRVAAIERIDEVEEMNLVLEHYAVYYGSVREDEDGEEFGLPIQIQQRGST